MSHRDPVLLPHEAPPPQPAGTQLAPGYRVIGHLNRGNRLDVYDAWSEERDSRCVLKTLRPDRAGERPARRALLQEGRLLRRFTHPNLVRAYELTAAIDDGRPVVVLETLDGETLSHLVHRLLEQGRRLPLAEAAVLGLQLASVLTYLHHHGWLHLDLKPSNIVASGGQARLIDLSIARRPGRARPGNGTFEYLSPEQARGGMLTTAADVWGLGAVLYAVLAGEPPYRRPDDDATADGEVDGVDGSGLEDGPADEREDVAVTVSPTRLAEEVVYPQLVDAPLPVRRHRRIPGDLAAIVDACLEQEPARRPTLRDVAGALDAWLVSRLGHGVRP
jgi:serine/threonine protein kinase